MLPDDYFLRLVVVPGRLTYMTSLEGKRPPRFKSLLYRML